MTSHSVFKLAASGLLATIGFHAPAFAAEAPASARTANADAARSATRAEAQLDDGRTDRAISYAERAVALAPDDARYRALLGQAYLAAGRFASAQDSFAAARHLGSNDSATTIGSVLSLLGTGRVDEASTLIEAGASTLPAADYGLALALAGQPERGVLVLTDIVRAGGSSARDRQNLALAYALAGRWLEARLIAAQDIPPAKLAQRLEEWATLASAGQSSERIATLLGTRPGVDPGMPGALAIEGVPSVSHMASGQTASGPLAVAVAADPAPLAQFAPRPTYDRARLVAEELSSVGREAPDVAVPQLLPAPASIAAPASVAAPAPAQALAPTPAPQPTVVVQANAPAIVAVSAAGTPYTPAPAIQQADNAIVMAATAAVQTAGSLRAATVLANRPTPGGRWAVQLGAFNSGAVARASWARLARQHDVLAQLNAITTVGAVRGRTYHRLVANGFASAEAARAACAALRSDGGTCFARRLGSQDRVTWASRATPIRMASR